MPIYEYECKKCGSTFEAMQRISAEPLKTCDMNGCKGKVRRLVSASGFILKGSGWYTSEYPSDSRKQGWESEGKQANSQTADTAGTAEKASTAPTENAPAKTEPKKPAKKPAAKNPYSGGNKKKAKTTK